MGSKKFVPTGWMLEAENDYKTMDKKKLTKHLKQVAPHMYRLVRSYNGEIARSDHGTRVRGPNIYYDRKKHITIDKGEMTYYYPYKRFILGNYPLDFEQFFELLKWFPRTPKKTMIYRVKLNPNTGDDLKLWLMLDSQDWLERN